MTDTYDQLPYPSRAFPLTHPDHLATVARVFGLSTPPVETCRVLELGCADGGNLFPMAAYLPDATFVGVDRAAGHIRTGRRLVDALGFDNVRLVEADIEAIGPDFGTFDYIIAHGVLSWIPDATRQQLFAICRDNLAEAGVAYLSFDVYPGSYAPVMLRKLLARQVDRRLSPAEQVAAARRVLSAFTAAAETTGDPRSAFLRAEQTAWETRRDSSLFHDFLGEHHHAFYLSEVAALAESYDLRFLSDAVRGTMLAEVRPPAWREMLSPTATLVEAQELFDFFENRRFRSCLFCHADQSVAMRVRPKTVLALQARAWVEPDPASAEVPSDQPLEVTGLEGERGRLSGTATRMALSILRGRFPAALPVSALVDEVRARVGEDAVHPAALAAELAALYFLHLVHFQTRSTPVVTEVTERPTLHPGARALAQHGAPLASPWHIPLELEALERRVLAQLDGTRTVEEVAAALDLNDPSQHVAQIVQAAARAGLLTA